MIAEKLFQKILIQEHKEKVTFQRNNEILKYNNCYTT